MPNVLGFTRSPLAVRPPSPSLPLSSDDCQPSPSPSLSLPLASASSESLWYRAAFFCTFRSALACALRLALERRASSSSVTTRPLDVLSASRSRAGSSSPSLAEPASEPESSCRLSSPLLPPPMSSSLRSKPSSSSAPLAFF